MRDHQSPSWAGHENYCRVIYSGKQNQIMENSSKNNIDDIFKQTFEGFEHEPSGNVWSNVKEALRSKSRRGIYMSFMSVAMVLGVAGVLTFALMSDYVAPDAAG